MESKVRATILRDFIISSQDMETSKATRMQYGNKIKDTMHKERSQRDAEIVGKITTTPETAYNANTAINLDIYLQTATTENGMGMEIIHSLPNKDKVIIKVTTRVDSHTKVIGTNREVNMEQK